MLCALGNEWKFKPNKSLIIVSIPYWIWGANNSKTQMCATDKQWAHWTVKMKWFKVSISKTYQVPKVVVQRIRTWFHKKMNSFFFFQLSVWFVTSISCRRQIFASLKRFHVLMEFCEGGSGVLEPSGEAERMHIPPYWRALGAPSLDTERTVRN